MPKVFVIILNWNRAEDTIACLKTMQKLKIKNYELKIVVVDNASRDSSVAKIKKQIANIKFIENKENLGFAEGNNVGLRYGLKNGADYLVVLNNDTLVDKNLLVELLKVAQKYILPKVMNFTKRGITKASWGK
jgi:GT2 family glycosyltransferase